MTEWPSAALTNVGRLRVLASAVPHARLAEAIVDAPFERVWTWFSDLERSVPTFDGVVRRLQVRRRVGTELRVLSWQGPGGAVPMPFRVDLEPNGWCLMTAPARLYLVGMCADPAADGRTHVGVLEAVPNPFGRWSERSVGAHVRGDVRRIGRALGVTSTPIERSR